MILVDTYTAIWLALDPAKLSKRAAAAIAEARRDDSGVGIAAISLWEVAMQIRKGRVEINVSLESFLRDMELSCIVLPLTGRIAARSMELGNGYPKDPADRIIGATALVEGLPLVTRDEKIRASKQVPTIW